MPLSHCTATTLCYSTVNAKTMYASGASPEPCGIRARAIKLVTAVQLPRTFVLHLRNSLSQSFFCCWNTCKSSSVFVMANRNLAHRDRNPSSPNAAEMGGAGYQEASSPPNNTMVSRFSRILDSFKTHLSQEDVDRFKVATFNDLKSAVRDIQTEQAGRKSLRNLNKIRPYLDGLEQYAAVIEVFVNSKPDILAFIWVGCSKFIIN